MALQGTMKDFALPDIFQLIGIQKKTGILTLESGEDTVTLKFLTGEVVGADTQSETLEDRLGQVLVRTGRITQDQLEEALKAQKNTLQRLGHILVNAGWISEEDLVDALRVQSSHIIYRLFRWHEGEYNFDPVENLEYDQKHFIPISAETILMEGARMIDEWPIIERRVKSPKVVFRLTEAAEGLDLFVSEAEAALDDDLDFDLGFGSDRQDPDEAPEESDDEITLSPEEKQILGLVDGKRSVEEICDLLCIGEFDTYRMLSELVTRALVAEVPRGRERVAADTRKTSLLSRAVVWLAQLALVGAILATVATLGANPVTPWRLLAAQPATAQLQYYASQVRLETIENAIQVFYLDAGSLPKTLTALSQNEYVRSEDLVDPWGRPYDYQLSSGGYRVVGMDANGEPSPELTVSRRLNSVQRLLLAGENDAP